MQNQIVVNVYHAIATIQTHILTRKPSEQHKYILTHYIYTCLAKRKEKKLQPDIVMVNDKIWNFFLGKKYVQYIFFFGKPYRCRPNANVLAKMITSFRSEYRTETYSFRNSSSMAPRTW